MKKLKTGFPYEPEGLGSKQYPELSPEVWSCLRQWWAVAMIWLLMYLFIDKVDLERVVGQALPGQEGAMLNGILLGDKSGIDGQLLKNFQDSGLIHLLVASGSNVMLLVGGGIESLAKWWSRKKAIITFLGAGWWYTGVVGWEIPVVRAMIFTTIIFAAQLSGRKFNLLRALLLSVVMMAAGGREVVTSVSFWLSVSAFVGVVTAGETGRYTVLWKTAWVSLFITPILALVFGRISLTAPVSNLLVLEAVEIITVIGGIGTIVGSAVPEAGKAVLWLTIPGLKFLKFTAETGAGGSVGVSFNGALAAGWYLILFWLAAKYNFLKVFKNIKE